MWFYAGIRFYFPEIVSKLSQYHLFNNLFFYFISILTYIIFSYVLSVSNLYFVPLVYLLLYRNCMAFLFEMTINVFFIVLNVFYNKFISSSKYSFLLRISLNVYINRVIIFKNMGCLSSTSDHLSCFLLEF